MHSYFHLKMFSEWKGKELTEQNIPEMAKTVVNQKALTG